jgi:hypothetical protein
LFDVSLKTETFNPANSVDVSGRVKGCPDSYLFALFSLHARAFGLQGGESETGGGSAS